MSKPVIGAINGAAVTGGLELALYCDILIASEHARFADTHARVGLLPTWGLSVRLPQKVGVGMARRMSLTGDYLSADDALRAGLVTEVVAARRAAARGARGRGVDRRQQPEGGAGAAGRPTTASTTQQTSAGLWIEAAVGAGSGWRSPPATTSPPAGPRCSNAAAPRSAECRRSAGGRC